MTGTGTQTDPYIIQNWDDFYNIADVNSYYKLGCDLDANDYNDGVWESCTLKCADFDGDSHTIWNINHQEDSDDYALVLNVADFHNINFKNTTANGVFLKISQGQTAQIHNCTLEANAHYFCEGAGSASGYYGRANFDKCIISHKGAVFGGNSGAYRDFAKTFTRCHINIDETLNHSQNTFLNCSFDHCRIEGSALLSASDTLNVKDCIVALKNTNTDVTSLAITGNSEKVSVIDTQLLGFDVSAEGVVGGTTAQLNDINWLDSNGFTVTSKKEESV